MSPPDRSAGWIPRAQARASGLGASRGVATVLFVVAAGFVAVAPLFFRSPSQAAASRQAPTPPSAFAVAAIRSVGTGRSVTCASTTPLEEVLAPATDAGEAGTVGDALEVGQSVSTGTRLAEVSGVPVLALVAPGSSPLRRNLHEGDSGSDVLAVEQGLVVADVLDAANSDFDAATTAALDRLYAAVQARNPLPRGLRRDAVVLLQGPGVVASRDVSSGSSVQPGDALLTVSGAPRAIRCTPTAGATGTQAPPWTLPAPGATATLQQRGGPMVHVIVSGVGPPQGPRSVTFRPAQPESALPEGVLRLDAVWLPRPAEALTVPLGALAGAGAGAGARAGGVYAVEKLLNNKPVAVSVTVLAVVDGYAQLAAGPLDAGDRVVVRQPAPESSTSAVPDAPSSPVVTEAARHAQPVLRASSPGVRS
jgi:hypothetical protein